jgi:hypothetical protein
MDSKKDNKNTGNDLKGQTQKTFYYQAPIASPLSDNPKIKDIECRSEKVSVALYLVTDLFEKGEPLQYSIRQNVTELLKSTKMLTTSNKASYEGTIISSITALYTIQSLVHIGESVGLISTMNSAVLYEQFSILSHSILELQSEYTSGKSFYSSGFLSKEKIVDFGELFSNVSLPKSLPVNTDSHKGQNFNKGQISHTEKKIVSIGHKRDEEKDKKKSELSFRLGRRNIILNIIREKREVTIKDIANIVTDCSEKTIQRELGNLVAELVLKKTGDKRWSRYSFLKA